MDAYTGDFELGGLVRLVDVYGLSGGDGLAATFGYVDIQDSLYRFAEITLPVVCDDLYEQTP